MLDSQSLILAEVNVLAQVNQEYLTMKVDVYLAWNDSRLNFGRLPGQRSRARSWIPLGR